MMEHSPERRFLQTLTDDVLLLLDALDQQMAQPEVKQLGKWLGGWAGKLDLANDQARYFGLGVDYRKDDKKKALAKLRQKRGGR